MTVVIVVIMLRGRCSWPVSAGKHRPLANSTDIDLTHQETPLVPPLSFVCDRFLLMLRVPLPLPCTHSSVDLAEKASESLCIRDHRPREIWTLSAYKETKKL